MQKLEDLETFRSEELVEKVVEYATSSSSLKQLNAVLWGTKHRVRDERFIAAMLNMLNSDARFFGMPLSDYTQAALHVLGVQEYTGDDYSVLRLIQSDFNFG